jgi:type II restriction enzyme
MRNFNEWLKTFRHSIAGYNYYINFDKVYAGVEKYKVEFNILNSLIGSKKIEDDFEKIIMKYPETLKCIPLLLAVRKSEIFAMDDDGEFYFNFDKRNYDIEYYKMFMRKTGLFDLISNHIINNLIDYALGVETGLDSNGRKNRGGHLMEDLVERYINSTGVEYYKEMFLRDIESKFAINLSALSNNGKASKRFDFVVKTENNIYAIETNFYSGGGGGSKLNETARSYKMLATEAKDIKDFVFVWITDGTSWKTAKGNLEETFDVLDTMYNIKDLENGILYKLFI